MSDLNTTLWYMLWHKSHKNDTGEYLLRYHFPLRVIKYHNNSFVDVFRKCSVLIFFNSLAPGGFENIFQNVFFKLISWIDTLSNSCETALRSMPQNPSDDKSTLVQVMAWCRQAASHYLSQCCPKSLSPYGVTRPQWVKYDLKIPSSASHLDIWNFTIKISYHL